MKYCEKISLQQYADTAKKLFGETDDRLYNIADSFQTRMNGKTKAGIIGSMFATICWAVAVLVFFGYIREYVNGTLHHVCFGLALALLGALLIDEIIFISYYGKISSYRDKINQLNTRVRIGKTSIISNQDVFMNARSNGWRLPLSVGKSIPEEAASIENTINAMDSLNSGFINGLKNFLFFAFAIAFTAAGSWTLFGTAGEIMTGISSEPIEGDTIRTLCIIGLVITVAGEIILARWIWSLTDCSVTNITLFIAVVGPLLFLALVALATVIVILAQLAIAVAAAGAVVAIAGACLFGSSSGG